MLCLLPMAMGLAVYDRLPETLPTHWGFSGEVNGWSSRAFVVFGLPLMMAGLGLFTQIMLENDPKKANMPEILKTVVRCTFPVMSFVLVSLTLMAGLGRAVPVPMVTAILVGALFIVLGNYMPKCRQTYTMGIRLPWTLSSEENWRRTHRLAGKLYTLAGILFLAAAFLMEVIPGNLGAILIIGVVVMLCVPSVYSFLLYKKGI